MIARLALASCLTVFTCYAVDAQNAQQPASQVRKPIFDIGEIEVPESDVTDVLEFLDEITELQKNIANDYRTAMTKISAAQAKASNQILDQAGQLSDEQFARAAAFGLAARVRSVAQKSEEDQRKIFELVERQLSIGVEKGLQRSELTNASTLASYLERSGETALAAEAYGRFAELLKAAKNPAYRAYSPRFEGSARRLSLLGNPIELAGKLLDGSDFDWDSYQGKVVLIDFWATWCGPCIAEAPNVRKNYDLYHDLGFEVVGISLDTDKKALEAYLEKENVPWVNLFQAGTGWKHPLALKYGVSAIPTVLLVDRDGKVVSLRARGAELGNQLKKLFDSNSDWERRIALYSERITPETTDAAIISRRAAAYIATEQWDLAESDWQRATELQPDRAKAAFDAYRRAKRWNEAADYGLKWVDQNPAEAMRWLMVAPILVVAGNDQAYREHSDRMAKRFGDTTDARESRLAIKACLLVPDVIESDRLPVDTLVKSNDRAASAWGWGVRALLAYRSGDSKAALEYLTKSNQLRPVDFARAANLPLLAMVQHELGDSTAASQALEAASTLLKRLEADETNNGHNDMLIGQILFREADAKINGESK